MDLNPEMIVDGVMAFRKAGFKVELKHPYSLSGQNYHQWYVKPDINYDKLCGMIQKR